MTSAAQELILTNTQLQAAFEAEAKSPVYSLSSYLGRIAQRFFNG